MKLVSVIVPIHNGQNVFMDCLESLVHQTLFAKGPDAMEIILVDDASTDHSLELIRKLESQLPDKIRVLALPENRGPGGARNAGMAVAQGQYIAFVDCDDAVAPTTMEKLYAAATEAETPYDIVECGFFSGIYKKGMSFGNDNVTGTLDDDKRSELIALGGNVWGRVYRRSFLEEHQMQFREKILVEDLDFFVKTSALARNYNLVKEVLYDYRDTPGSAVKYASLMALLQNDLAAVKACGQVAAEIEGFSKFREGLDFVLVNTYETSRKQWNGYRSKIPTREERLQCKGALEALRQEILGLLPEDWRQNPFLLKKYGKKQAAKLLEQA